MSRNVQRHFLTVPGRRGARQVHYHRAGSGPLIVLLHQSPQSSRELVPLMERWSADYTLVAPDTPGYGLSDPLDSDECELSDLAVALMEFLDALGARRFSVYGFHTGGMIGVALAHQFPERVIAAGCNGMALLTAEERADILDHYFPPFRPHWDGGHLAWLWARNREQTVFFPWYRHQLDARMRIPVPPPDALQAGTLEFLRAAGTYAVGYRAAFRFRGERVVPELRTRVLVTAAEQDPLCAHLSRLSNVPEGVIVEPSVDSEAALERAFGFAAEYAAREGAEAPPPATPGAAAGSRVVNDFVRTPSGTLRIRRSDAGHGPVTILLHGSGGSSATVDPLTASMADHGPVVAIDLPGHGESDYASDPGLSPVVACARAVCEAMDALGIDTASLAGIDGGAMTAIELSRIATDRVRQLVLVDPPLVDPDTAAGIIAGGLPSLEPEWSGAHLLRAWNLVRDGRLFYPWFRCEPAAARWHEPDLDEERLQLEVTELLKAEGRWQPLRADELRYAAARPIDGLAPAPFFCATAHTPHLAAIRAAAETTGQPFVELPAALGEGAAAIRAALRDT